MRVRYSPRSIEDLDSIRLHISKDNPKAAWVVASFIRRSIAVLQEWPYHGRATEKENVRRLVVMNYPYVVYYRVGDDVLILTVMHSAQNRA
jgi:toxin ParE1/3/4